MKGFGVLKVLLLVLTGVTLTGAGLGLAAAAFLPTLFDINIGETAAQMESACHPPGSGESESRAAVDSPEAVARFQEKHDFLVATLQNGAPEAVIPFDESEVTSRANAFLRERDAPVQNVIICFYEGEAEARANVRIEKLARLPLIGSLFDANVRVRGTLHLEGEHPQLVIAELKAGYLPGVITGELKYELEDIVDERLRSFTIERRYSVTFHDGLAELRVQPFE